MFAIRWMQSLRNVVQGLKTGAHGSQRRLRSVQSSPEVMESRALLATIIVTSTADNQIVDGQVTLREAVLAANTDLSVDGSVPGTAEDVIVFASNLSGPITLNGTEISISSPMTIIQLSSEFGANRRTISGNFRSRIFNVTYTAGDVTFQNLNLVDGSPKESFAPGGAIQSRSPGLITVSNCLLRSNTASGTGGAINNHFGTLNVINSQIESNLASRGGGGIAASGSLTIQRSTITGNTSDYTGAGISFSGGTLSVIQSGMGGNQSKYGGGAIYATSCDLSVIQSSLVNNSIRNLGYGSAIHIQGFGVFNQSTLSIQSSTLTGNSKTAVFAQSTPVEISQSTLTKNQVALMALDPSKTVDISNSIIAGNQFLSSPGDPDIDTGGYGPSVSHSLIGTSLGTVLVATDGDAPDANGNFIGGVGVDAINPMLGPTESANGTTVVLPLAGSLALNHGSLTLIPPDLHDLDGDFNTTEAVPFDQRGSGFSRVSGLGVDMGAAELQVPESPSFTSSAVISVDENTPSAATIHTVTATDPQGDPLTYSISGGADSARFVINALTGGLNFLQSPDYEIPADADRDNLYDVQVTVSDGVHAVSQTVEVTVTNVYEVPAIVGSNIFSVAENTSYVTTITTTGPDSTTYIEFSIAGGADGENFEIEPSSGQLSFAVSPDFEHPSDFDADNVYHVRIQVSDGVVLITKDINIEVIDTLNEPPVITSGDQFHVPENNMIVGTVTAEDPNPDSTLSYSITGGTNANKFRISSSTGELTFLVAPDFETVRYSRENDFYEVEVGVSNGVNLVTQFIAVTITDVNEVPTFTSESTFSIPENNEAGRDFTIVTASDPELSHNPEDTHLSFFIAGGADAALFELDPFTQELYFLVSADFEAPADSDEDNVYHVEIGISDGLNTTSQDIALTVTNRNETPELSEEYEFVVPENSVQVGLIDVSDPDADSTLIFSISGGEDADRFLINTDTGQLKFKSPPDYEAPADADFDGVYYVLVDVTDGEFVVTQGVFVAIEAVNEAPLFVDFENYIDEGTPAEQLFTAFAIDPEEDTLRYSISGGEDADKFSIDALTGDVYLLVTPDYESPLDANGDNIYVVRVDASDGINNVSRVFTLPVVNLNEDPIDISLSGNSLPENAGTNFIVGTLSATDPDVGDVLLFSLPAGLSDNSLFSIDGTSLRANNSFDFEALNTYSVVIRVTDAEGLTFDKSLTIHVTDVQEDVTAPVSRVNALPASSSSVTLTISVTGNDPGAGASGVKEYDVYYSTGGDFIKFATLPSSAASTTFTGLPNTSYWFRSIARDNAGNLEIKNSSDAVTRIGDIVPPTSQVTSATPTSNGLFTIQLTGAKPSGSPLTSFDVYVRIDGGEAILVGTSSGVAQGGGNFQGQMQFQALLDGISHTYQFYSRGRDGAGNVEAAPSEADLSSTYSFAVAGITATAIDVQNGVNQRSYVRYLDVLFSTSAGLNALLANGRVKVERFGIGATSVTPETGTAVTGFGIVQNGSKLRLDFGASGLGGLRQAGNGFYRILLDLDGNGSFADVGDKAFEFHRLFGDANGDAKVDANDTSVVNSMVGRSGANLDGDIDGSGAVNTTDRLYVTQQVGKALASPLLEWLDD